MVERGVVYVPEGMKVFPNDVLENLQIGAYSTQPDTATERTVLSFFRARSAAKSSAGS